jgi:hygromycin-B 7''-O-kinase
VARDIALSHGLGSAAPHIFATGTNLLVALDPRLILKIFPPMLRSQFVSERGALMQLHGRLSLPIPEIVAEGERDGWPCCTTPAIRSGTSASRIGRRRPATSSSFRN